MRLSDTALILASVALFVFLSAHGYPPHQDWSIQPSGRPGMVHLTLTRAAEGSRWQNSTDVRAANFRGLPADSIGQLSGPAKFTLIADSARLECEGTFHFGHGSGSFTFSPNPEFAAEMERLGYPRPTEDQAFAMMTSGVTLDFARGIRDAGLGGDTGALIDLRNHGVDLEAIREFRWAGYSDFNARDFIHLKNHGVTPAFAKELKRAGFNFQAREIAELRNHGVDGDFIAGIKSAGYDLSAREINELRNHGVSPDYLRDLKAYGLKPDPREIVQLRQHGVTPDYLKDLKDAGYGSLSVKEVTELRNHGVPGDLLRDSRAAGFDFSSKDLVHLRSHGVDGAYLKKLHDSGFGKLDARQIARLRSHGID
jgi:hypothetical protein